MTDVQADDEALGVEQLPQDGLEAAPGEKDPPAPDQDVNAAAVATAPTDAIDPHASEQPET
jgi:hypothetical protein